MNSTTRFVCVFLTLFTLTTTLSRTLAREWTDATGKFKVEAELVSVEGGNVQLKRADGRVIKVPLARLCEADRQFLAALGSTGANDLMKFVPSDMPLVVSVRPHRLLNDKAVEASPVLELIERVALADSGSPVLMLRRIGQSLETVEELVVVISALPDPKLRRSVAEEGEAAAPPTVEEIQASQRGYLPTYVMIVRFKTPLDRQRVEAALYRPQAIEIAGYSGFGPGKEPSLEPVTLLLDERTLLVGDPATARRMATAASASADETMSGKFDAAWDLQVRVNVGAVRELAPPAADPSMDKLANAAEDVTLAAKLGESPAVEIVTDAKSEEDAQQFMQGLTTFQVLGSNLVAQRLEQLTAPDAEQADGELLFMEQAKKILDDLKIDTAMKQVKISYAGSLGVDQLMAMVNKRPLPGAEGSEQEIIGKVYATMIKPAADADAEEIRYRAGSAAGLSFLDLSKIAMTAQPPTSDMIADQPLTLSLLLLHMPKEGEDAANEEFKFSGHFTPKPAELATFLTTGPLGYGTLLPYEFITDVTVEKQGETASGVISFTNPSFLIGYSGKVNYLARQRDGHWQIVQFAFPVRGLTFDRQADGTWKAKGLEAASESGDE